MRLRDHARVAWLLVRTVAGGIPFLLYLPLSPVLTPWLRARARRRLGAGTPPLIEPTAATPAGLGGRTIFLVAGEASGDDLAAGVVRALRERAPDVRVRGYAGPACAAAGVALDRDLTSRAVFGFFAVVWSLGFWWRVCAETLARFREDPPDLLLTVDFPGLNVRLAQWAHKQGIATAHLVAPQLWAHTPWRILRWRKSVDLLLATFPFEPALFEDSGIPTRYVGHPLFEAPLPPARGAPAWPAAGSATVELWPGSRRRELTRHASVLVEAAADIAAARPDTRFVVRLARARHEALFERGRRAARRAPGALACVVGPPDDAGPLLGAVASSGTATAQLAADLVPVAVFYRVGFVEWCFAKALITAPWICLANLVLGRDALPERVCFVRGAGAKIARDFLGVAGSQEAWERTRADLVQVRDRLASPRVAERAASVLLDHLAAASSSPAGAPS